MTIKGFIDRHGAGRWAVNFGLILILFAAGAGLNRYQGRENRATRYDFCIELEQVRTYARDAAKRGLSSIPSIAYYKHHARERRKAISDLQRQVMFFSPPLDCDQFANS